MTRARREILARTVAGAALGGACVMILLVGPDPLTVLGFSAACCAILISRLIQGPGEDD